MNAIEKNPGVPSEGQRSFNAAVRAVTEASPVEARRLRLHLALLLAGIAVPLFALVLAFAYQSWRNTLDRTSDGLMREARSISATIDSEIAGYAAALSLLALSPNLVSRDYEAFRPEAALFLSKFGGASGDLLVADASGRTLFVSSLPDVSRLPRRSDSGWRDQVINRKRLHISDMRIGSRTANKLFTIEVPVLPPGGEVLVLAFNPSQDAFQSLLERLDPPREWVISIFVSKLQHVARSPVLHTPRITFASETLRSHMAMVREGIVTSVSIEGNEMLTAFTRSANGWSVALGAPKAPHYSAVRSQVAVSLAIAAAVYVLALTLAWGMAARISRGVRDKELLVNELNHRVKNTLASVQAIVAQTLRRAAVPAEVTASVADRLSALGRAHTFLSGCQWKMASLREIAETVLESYLATYGSRIRMDGPTVLVPAATAVPLALVVNELAANAIKHGALRDAGGTIRISWARAGGRLSFVWSETSSLGCIPPKRQGFGSLFIDRAISYELGGSARLDYEPDGLRVTIDIPLATDIH